MVLLVLPAVVPGSAEPAPAVALQDLNGKPFSLAGIKGNVVVLDFWASWCAPCRKSFPFFNALQERHAAAGLRVVGLTLEADEEIVRKFLVAVPARFTIVRDPSERMGEEFAVVAMPTTFLIDREGGIAARFEGGDESVHGQIEAAVLTLLAGKTLAAGTGVRVAAGAEATGDLKAWQRGHLADPIMSLDGDPLARIIKEHIHASKEAAAGDGGAAGGGCGCN